MSVTAVPLQPTPRRVIVTLLVGLALLAAAGAVLAWAGTRDKNAEFFSSNGRQDGVVTTASGVQYKVLEAGQGPKPTDADHVFITYKGELLTGEVFDESQQPVDFPVQGVVPGFAEALKLMPRGSRLTVWIPPQLGYGAEARKDPTGKTVIPENSVLKFDIGMLGFLPEAQFRQMQMGMMGAPGAGAPPPPQGN